MTLPNLSACLSFHQSFCLPVCLSKSLNIQLTTHLFKYYMYIMQNETTLQCNAFAQNARQNTHIRCHTTWTTLILISSFRLNCCIVSIFRAANQSGDTTSHAGLPTVVDSYAVPHSIHKSNKKNTEKKICMKSSNKEIAQYKTKCVTYTTHRNTSNIFIFYKILNNKQQ